MPFELTADDQAQPLTRRLNGPDFTQQGQVDWVSLSKTAINFSLGILSRLSAASIDPYTLTIGHYIGGIFELSRGGRSNLKSALSQLKTFGSVGQALWFGFGIKNVVRSISVTEEGATLVAPCAAMSECFSEEYAAEILAAVLRAKAHRVHHRRATPFPLQAERRMKMHTSSGGDRATSLSSPESMANVLIGLGNVTRGVWTSISVLGGCEAGWLAAFAEWLFGLSVVITDESGNVIFTNCQEAVAQLNITYGRRNNKYKHDLITITEKTYNLLSAREFLRRDGKGTRSSEYITVRGRTEWGSLLSNVFGQQFERLSRMGDTVGEILGCSARLFEAIGSAESEVSSVLLDANDLYCDGSMGRGFIRHLLDRFPELLFASKSMDNSCSITLDDARSKYQACLKAISASCRCTSCSKADHVLLSPREPCLVATMETIILLGRLSSITTESEGLLPHVNGVWRLYEAQKLKRKQYEGTTMTRGGFDKTFQHVLHWKDEAINERIDFALCLFSGRTLEDLGEDDECICAISDGGICVYLDALVKVSDDRERVGRICVTPGRIEYNDKPFQVVRDKPHFQRLQFQSEEDWDILSDFTQMSDIILSVQEKSRYLAVEIRVLNENGKDTERAFTPGGVTLEISASRGSVKCEHRDNGSEGRLIPNTADLSLNTQLAATGMEYRVVRAPLFGRCVALVANGDYHVILRDRECLQCCLKYGLQQRGQHPLIILTR